MIAIARRDVPGVDFQVGDFNALPFEDGAFDAIISSHALLFADDRTAALREWRRVSRSGGRLSLSVPGPEDRTPAPCTPRSTAPRRGAHVRLPEAAELADGRAMPDGPMRRRSGSTVAIRLPDADAFAPGAAPARGVPRPQAGARSSTRPSADMLAVTPRQPDGGYAIRSGRSTSPRGTEPAGRRPASRRAACRLARRPASGRPRGRRPHPSRPTGRASDPRPPAARPP